jgi:hypothetical protein
MNNPWGDKIEDEAIKMIGLRNRMLRFFICVYENSITLYSKLNV